MSNTQDTSADGHSDFHAPLPAELDAHIGSCRVDELIGQGGMGAIYRGEQTKLDRLVAIKVLPRSFGAELDYASRFEREAKAMARLTHNNIIGVFDYGETDDGELLYIIMEYVEGGTLLDLIHDCEISTLQAVGVMRQICSALQYAHEKGVVHRDIKPSNILIEKGSVVKIADFGLAKVKEAQGVHDHGTSETALGTPDYVAPEVLVHGAEADHRADIFSVGVLFYKILTGLTPRGSINPPSTLRPGIDRRVDGIVAKAMAPNPANRYQTIATMDRQLEELEGKLRSRNRQAPRRRAATRAAGPRSGPLGSARSRGPRTAPQPMTVKHRSRSDMGVWLALIVAAVIIGGIYLLISRAKPDAPIMEDPKDKFDPTDPSSFEVGGESR
jgi:serine/threonine protein kinase